MTIDFTRRIPGKPTVRVRIESESEDMPILEVWAELIVPALTAAGYTANQINSIFNKEEFP
jgi:hypothetical protein